MFKFAIRTLPERLADDDTAGNGFDPALYDAGKSKKFAFILGICAICNQKGHQGPECWAPVRYISNILNKPILGLLYSMCTNWSSTEGL